jgi:spore coat assembly protein
MPFIANIWNQAGESYLTGTPPARSLSYHIEKVKGMQPVKGFGVGDIVGRKSYNFDIYFKITEINKGPDGRNIAKLKGLHMRLCASAPLDDLVKIDPAELADYLREQARESSEHLRRIFIRREKVRQFSLERGAKKGDKGKKSDEPVSGSNANGIYGFDVPGSVLHIDGDGDYLELCLTTYKRLSIPAHGYSIEEAQQPEVVEDLLVKHSPDLLVLTGHDGFIKGKENYADIDNYYSSKYFVKAVKAARRYEKSMDDLVIFAGACQSHYEALLAAGANFASSPQRVMIHAYDPVFVVEKIAYTSIFDPISIREVITDTITGFSGIGGVETRGKFRLGLPTSPY